MIYIHTDTVNLLSACPDDAFFQTGRKSFTNLLRSGKHASQRKLNSASLVISDKILLRRLSVEPICVGSA